MQAFLGLVRYISVFLPKLAEFLAALMPLTTKDMERSFPKLSATHQVAFDAIKGLVVSWECLTVIDHSNPGDNKIFMTTDASDLQMGVVLSWGPSWELACPMEFDLMQLNDVQKCYPIHEKELLAIIHALKKWRMDLLGGQISIFTDHRTLKNFNMQRDLSCRQAHWQEFTAQFEMKIYYVKGKDNMVTDALSHLPVVDITEDIQPHYKSWIQGSVNITMTINTDESFLKDVKKGYLEDNFVKKITTGTNVPGMCEENSLWYVGDRLIIPQTASYREDLFHLAYDSMVIWC